MVTRRQRQNLRRGGAPATPEAAAHARAAKAQALIEGNHLAQLAAGDPWAAYAELHATMTKHITKLLRDEQRSNSSPKREITDRLREYGQTTEALAVYRASRGGVEEEAEAFFKELAARIPNLEALAATAKPLTEPPPLSGRE